MPTKLKIVVQESKEELQNLLKASIQMFHPRIKMLLVMIKHGEEGISKRKLMAMVGASGQSIQTWRTNYQKGGIELLLQHNRKSPKAPIFSQPEHEQVKTVLNDPKNNLTGYKDLQEWCVQTFKRNFSYNSIFKYAVRHFGTTVKVARKSHVKKDEVAVDTFKKNLVNSVKL